MPSDQHVDHQAPEPCAMTCATFHGRADRIADSELSSFEGLRKLRKCAHDARMETDSRSQTTISDAADALTAALNFHARQHALGEALGVDDDDMALAAAHQAKAGRVLAALVCLVGHEEAIFVNERAGVLVSRAVGDQ